MWPEDEVNDSSATHVNVDRFINMKDSVITLKINNFAAL